MCMKRVSGSMPLRKAHLLSILIDQVATDDSTKTSFDVFRPPKVLYQLWRFLDPFFSLSEMSEQQLNHHLGNLFQYCFLPLRL